MGSIAPPSYRSSGLVEGRPCLSTIQPSGIFSPLFLASLILPSATFDVEKSRTKGGPLPVGRATDRGFVEKTRPLPPYGATNPPGPPLYGPELHMIIPIIFSSAAIWEYSPSRPMWLQWITPTAAAPHCLAFSTAISIALLATT